MRHVREILRLECAGISRHQIARLIGVVPSTVRETLKRFAASGLTWPLGEDVTDAVLEARMYRNAGKKQGHRQYAEPDWGWIHRELKRKHVTLSILWEEYIAQHSEGYRYSRFCDLYRGWEGKLLVTMRQPCSGFLSALPMKPLPLPPMPAATSCLSIMRATGWRYSIG